VLPDGAAKAGVFELHGGKVTVKMDGLNPVSVSGRVLTAPAINAHNTFANPQAVKPAAFTGAQVAGGLLTVALPPKSVVVLELQ